MNFRFPFALSLLFLMVLSCKTLPKEKVKTATLRYRIDTTLTVDERLQNVIDPYKKRLNKEMGEILTYSPVELKKGFNANLPNLSADLFLETTTKIYQKTHKRKVDAALLNAGGLRRSFGVGDINRGHVFELMPFDNRALVLELSAATFTKMVNYLRKDGRPHAISGFSFYREGEPIDIRIQGEAIDPNKTYLVATSDFLKAGGDGMTFFSEALHETDLNILIRDVIFDYFRAVDTLQIDSTPRYLKR